MKISVRSLAEFVFRAGDLYPPGSGRRVEPDEGLRAQRAVQNIREQQNPRYSSEVSYRVDCSIDGTPVTLSGRADGVCRDETTTLIEEFKCTAALPEQPYGPDFGQTLLYAGLDATTTAPEHEYRLKTIYVHPDTLATVDFDFALSGAAALAWLGFTLLCYEVRRREHRLRVASRQAFTQAMPFPYADYRSSQRAIARRVYLALENRENLLLEAPTGSGKTLGTLYPGFKQIQDEKLFYLTSRNTGAQAPLAAVRQLDPEQRQLSVVEITAKEKTCFVEGMPCSAEQCEYARGYFDRRDAAVRNVISDRLADRTTVERVARSHTVCPFELSLDSALWADLIVGDYNYMLDPVVRLKRFSQRPDMHLLIDEAHQLGPRVGDMLTARIERGQVKRALDEGPSNGGIEVRQVKSLDRALLKVRRLADPDVDESSILSLERAMTRLLAEVDEMHLELTEHPALAELYFACQRWLRSQEWYPPDQAAVLLFDAKPALTLTRLCLDPGQYMAEVFSEYGAIVRFSGTVSPLPLYQTLHGGNESLPGERAGSPFTGDQVGVFVIPDVPTYLRQRERTATRISRLLMDLQAAAPGRYLVVLPSFAYLDLISGTLEADLDHTRPACAVVRQVRGLTAADAEQQIRQFADEPEAFLMIVMGGMLSESVDFADFGLKGVCVVGLGLPPPSDERQRVADYFEAQHGEHWGELVAYTQPALVKVVQAAGRLIRDPTDRGIICLVDDRFRRPEITQFFPAYWNPREVRSTELRKNVEAFWNSPETS